MEEERESGRERLTDGDRVCPVVSYSEQRNRWARPPPTCPLAKPAGVSTCATNWPNHREGGVHSP